MTILFSPSESKTEASYHPVSLDSMWPQTLAPARKEVFARYKALLNKANQKDIAALFGLKDTEEIAQLCHTDMSKGVSALERYTGVAYDFLDIATLPPQSLAFLQKQVIIFSNLFGPVLGGPLPYYKIKQGQSIDGFKPEVFYKKESTPLIDAHLEGDFVVDLRAGYYEKFYTLKQPYVAMKFLKNGKSVSHWAKAYRGKVLRHLALAQPSDEQAFATIPFEGLRIREIQHKGLAHWYLFDIVA